KAESERLVTFREPRIELDRAARRIERMLERGLHVARVPPLHELRVRVRDAGPRQRVVGIELDRLLEMHERLAEPFLGIQPIALTTLEVEIVGARIARLVLGQSLDLFG